MFSILLVVHIICGAISLLLGLVLLMLKKGTSVHRTIGKIYFFAMLMASVVAIPMAMLHASPFLFLISIFSSYMLLTGVRYIHKTQGERASIFDWALTAIMLLFAIAFFAFGSWIIVKGNLFGIVLLVFGGIGTLFSFQDYANFTGKSNHQNLHLTTHLQRMVGSYIAASTAFLVVNNTILPGVVAWLFPTVLLAPLIAIWTRKYKVVKK